MPARWAPGLAAGAGRRCAALPPRDPRNRVADARLRGAPRTQALPFVPDPDRIRVPVSQPASVARRPCMSLPELSPHAHPADRSPEPRGYRPHGGRVAGAARRRADSVLLEDGWRYDLQYRLRGGHPAESLLRRGWAPGSGAAGPTGPTERDRRRARGLPRRAGEGEASGSRPGSGRLVDQGTSSRRTGRCSRRDLVAMYAIRIACIASRAVHGLSISPRATRRNSSSSSR